MKSTYLISTALIILGVLLLFARADREFINLRSTEGQDFRVPLEAGHTYEQRFTTTRTSITKLGLVLVPLAQNLPEDSITVEINDTNKTLATQQIPAVFINDEGTTQIEFNPRINVSKGDRIATRITVPEKLSNKVGLQIRQRDTTFSGANVQLFIDNQEQQNPAAYQVFFAARPPLALQVGALLIMAGIIPLITPKNKRWHIAAYAIIAATLASLPAILLDFFPPGLIIIQAAVFLLIYLLLLKQHRSTLAAFFGAHIAAFTTWFPLHILGDNSLIEVMQLRDIFLDPNQISVSHQAGSYIGFPAAIFAIIGIVAIVKGIFRKDNVTQKITLGLGALGLILTYLVTPHAIILTTAAVAYFAANGFDHFRAYLGESKLVTGIFFIILILSLLDLWHVLATTIEYQLI